MSGRPTNDAHSASPARSACRSTSCPDADLESLRGRNVWVHCAAGFRATIAASILERAGIRCAIVDDLIDVAAELGLAGVPEPDEDAAAVDAEHAGEPARPAVAPIAA